MPWLVRFLFSITTFFALFPVLCLPNFHAMLISNHFRKYLHHFFGYLNNTLMNPLPSLCTYSEKLNIVLLQESHIIQRNLFIFIVAFVDKAKYVLITVRILFGLLDPKLLQVLKWFRIVNITDQNNSICSFIIRLGNSSEPLLPSRVPNLQLNKLLTDIQRPVIIKNLLKSEINTNGRNVTLLKTVISKSFKDWWFANTGRPNNNELKDIIVIALHSFG